jgi:hypothetical protein
MQISEKCDGVPGNNWTTIQEKSISHILEIPDTETEKGETDEEENQQVAHFL